MLEEMPQEETSAPVPLCCGVSRSGAPCRFRAKYGDPPRWCVNCDPDQADRRKANGAKRHPRLAPRGADPRGVPTIDYVVDQALDVAARVVAGDLDPIAGRTVAQLLCVAIEGLRARGSVGDLTANPKAPEDGGTSEAGGLEEDGSQGPGANEVTAAARELAGDDLAEARRRLLGLLRGRGVDDLANARGRLLGLLRCRPDDENDGERAAVEAEPVDEPDAHADG
jgi:hypothetical protein